jgi:hypothetical protein
MAKLCVAVNDKSASREFVAIFQSGQSLSDSTSAKFKIELDTIPQDLREAILAATFHAVLAISYNSFWWGFWLRAQIADMFEKPKDKITSTQIVMDGVSKAHYGNNTMVHA